MIEEDSGRPRVARADACARVRSQLVRRGPLSAEVSGSLTAGFGARVRDLRVARGWSQGQVAEELGVDRRTVGRLELGQRRPTLQQVVLLARVLAPEGTSSAALESELLGLAGEHVRYRRGGQKVGVVSLRQVKRSLRQRAGVRRGGRF